MRFYVTEIIHYLVLDVFAVKYKYSTAKALR